VPVDGTLSQYQMLQGILIGSAGNYADRLASTIWPTDEVFAQGARVAGSRTCPASPSSNRRDRPREHRRPGIPHHARTLALADPRGDRPHAGGRPARRRARS
jgi:hypothetical protein